MAPKNSAKAEQEKKLKSLLSFASKLEKRFSISRETTLQDELQAEIRLLPLPPSSTVAARQIELDKLGTELWNLSTVLRREQQPNGMTKDETLQRSRALCLLRVFAFLLLDTACGQATKARERKHCIRLIKVALKAARVCIEHNELGAATKVLERAADYQDELSKESDSTTDEKTNVTDCLRIEYFAVRTTLAWRQGRMDTAEHLWTKSRQLDCAPNASTIENIADLLYEMGKDLLGKRNYELAVKWLERAYDVLGERNLEDLGPEIGELRLSIMHNIVQAYMKLKTHEAQGKAWDMVKLLEIDYCDKMAVQLLKLELLSTTDSSDSTQYYAVLLRMIRSVVLNETNFKTIMHHIHRLRDISNSTACKLLDEFIDIRLLREDNQIWIEKALITRIWGGTTNDLLENTLERLQELLETISRNTKAPLSAPATHAAQTLLWKRVEAAYSQEQFTLAETWCRLCLHPLLEKAGELNKSKIARKIVMCTLSRKDYGAAREAFTRMSDAGKEEPITRYLMYKVALQNSDSDFAAECLDLVCQRSAKDATLLYACVLEAQNIGDKRQAIFALEKVLDKYEHSAPAGIHLPALLRCTARLLIPELIKNGKLDHHVVEEICKLFAGACTQAKASRRRPATPTQQLFTPSEFEWFSKNAYNISLKYCAEMHPRDLVRLLSVCSEFIKLLKEHHSPGDGDLPFRLMFCDFLAACAYTTLARAEDNIQDCLQFYLKVQKHSEEYRRTAAEKLQAEELGESARADIIAKHFQVLKLEIEAVLRLEKWDALDELFEECWKYSNSEHLETLADLVLVVYSCVTEKFPDGKYRSKILAALQKIINITWHQSNNDINKLSRWMRVFFQLTLSFDESSSLKVLDQASQMAAARQGESNHYPTDELEWLATTSFNHAVDHYLQDSDRRAKTWAEKAISLAQWAEDGGKLRDVFMEKYSGIVWQE